MRGEQLTITRTTTFHVEECCNCGVVFAMTDAFYRECMRMKAGKAFCCPNGHSQWYTGKSDAQLRAEAEAQARAEADQRIAAENELRKVKAKAKRDLTAARTRAGNGVCPCCHRSFVQLARHVRTRHPDFTP